MNTASIPILYGIKNCDTVKKARQWLSDQGTDHRFHDFKTQGVPADHLDRWLLAAGWETLLNRKGTAWRKLEASIQASVHDAAGARTVMLEHSSVIKRPVVEWDGGPSGRITVGFKPEQWLSHSRLLT